MYSTIAMVMTIELDTKTALGILRTHQTRINKSHNRTHDGSMEDTVNRMRAIDGICGSCDNLKLETTRDFIGRQTVSLRCLSKYSPLGLYRKTGLGQKPDCLGLKCD